MENNSALSAAARRVAARVKKRDVMLFAAFFAMAYLTHIYIFTHKFLNHDDIVNLFSSNDSGLIMGRWFAYPVSVLFGRNAASSSNGLIGAAFHALSALMVVKIFELRSAPAALAAGLAFVAYPSAAATYTYMFNVPINYCSMFLAFLGVYLIRLGGWKRLAAGAVIMAFGLGIYQAYFTFAAAFMVTALIRDICLRRWDNRWKDLLLEGLRLLLGLVAGLALYLIIMKVCLVVTGQELIDYAGLSSMGTMGLQELFTRILKAYYYFFTLPGDPIFTMVHSAFKPFMWIVMALPVIAVAAAVVREKIYRSPMTLAILVALLAITPLSINLIYVMTEAWAVHELMTYPCVLLWIFPAVVADGVKLPKSGEWKTRVVTAAACLCLAVSALCGGEGFLMTGKAYLIMDMSEKTVSAYLTRMSARIESTEGYNTSMSVAFVGSFDFNCLIPDYDIVGIKVGSGAANMYSRFYLFNYFAGYNIGYVPPETLQALSEREEVVAMPSYPADGSIRIVDGTVVVKLS